MPESLDELVVARVEHLVAAKGQGVAFVDKYISGGKERVLRAVVFGLVAGHQRVSVAKTHIADEFLYPRSEVLVIADQVGIVDADAGSCGCSPRMGKQELAGKPLRWPRCPGRRPPESPFSPGGRAGEGPSKGCARAFVLEPTTDVPEPPMNRHPPAHRPYIPRSGDVVLFRRRGLPGRASPQERKGRHRKGEQGEESVFSKVFHVKGSFRFLFEKVLVCAVQAASERDGLLFLAEIDVQRHAGKVEIFPQLVLDKAFVRLFDVLRQGWQRTRTWARR